jgi:hypothetical protein
MYYGWLSGLWFLATQKARMAYYDWRMERSGRKVLNALIGLHRQQERINKDPRMIELERIQNILKER